MAQYALGAAAIYVMYQGVLLMCIALLAASYFSTILGGKWLGIKDEMQRDANASVPRLVNTLWTLTCFFAIVVFASTIAGAQTIGGFHIPVNATQALIMFYACAVLRDLFLAKFYFAQHL